MGVLSQDNPSVNADAARFDATFSQELAATSGSSGMLCAPVARARCAMVSFFGAR